MQIQFKQPEIEEALKDFIIKQGLTLKGREVTIDFTSGRKDNGITADIAITDGEFIPGFETQDTDEATNHDINRSPALKAVSSPPVAPVSIDSVEPTQTQAVEPPAPPASSSLFGS